MDLREKRFWAKLTQYDLAKLTGLPQSKISLIERGYIKPTERDTQKLQKAFNEVRQ